MVPNLSRREISRRLAAMGTPASRRVVRKLFKKHGLGQRKVSQEKVARLKAGYLARGESVISIDTKKKELIGNFSHEGQTHTQAQCPVSAEQMEISRLREFEKDWLAAQARQASS